MQCPNCNKEAINVNGKYVCLDCGIEVNPGDQVQDASAQPEPIVNHETPSLSPAAPATVPADDSADASAATPQPVAEENLVQPSPVSSGDSVRDEFIKEIDGASDQSFGAQAESTSGESQPASVVPDFPASVSGLPESAPSDVAPTMPSDSAEPVLPQSETTVEPAVSSPDSSQILNSNDALPSTNPVEEPETPTTNPDPENYFQPSQVNITPSQVSPVASNDSFDALSTPSGISSGEPMIGELPSSVPESPSLKTPDFPVTESVQSSAPETQPAGDSLDSLLNSYAAPSMGETNQSSNQGEPVPSLNNPVDGVQSLNQTNAPLESSQDPSGQIPSYESVFGGGNVESQKVDVSPKKNTKKILIIAGIAIAAILILAGVIFGILSIVSNKNNANSLTQDWVTLSQSVQEAMEADINVEVVYNQTIDFSKATLSASAKSDPAKALAVAPSTNKGTWQISQAGDISYDATVNGTEDKKIYIESEKSTYAFNKTASSWDKKSGSFVATVPALYGWESRGKVFYNNQSNSMKSLGNDEIDGTSYQKYQISPKSELIQSLLISSNSALVSAKIESIDTANLEVFVWLDDEKRIKKVSASGDVTLRADIFDGDTTVAISSEATYEYKDELIIKNPLSLNEVVPVRATQATQQIDKEIKTNVIKASTAVEDPAGRG